MRLETLTREQKELMYQTRDEWIDSFYNTKRIDKQSFEEGVKWLYEDLLKKKNPKVLYCESWLEALATIHILQYYKGDTVGANIRNNVWANVGDNVRDTVRNNVWDNVKNNVGDTVKNNVGDTVGDNSSRYLDMGSNFGWASFYDYFERIGVLKDNLFSKYKKLIRAGAFQVYEYENYVFAVQPPTRILRNLQGQMNSTEVKAFEWSDGYGFYYINGMTLLEEIFNKLSANQYTPEDFFRETNEETKSAVIGFIQQKYGEEELFNFLRKNLKEIDTYVDKKEDRYLKGTTKGMNVGVYTLFRGEINGEDIAYVRCYCPSTDRMFFLGVEPIYTNAKDAIASLYRVPKRLKDNIRYINRQGERFSTVFDDEGNNIMKNLTQEDIQDVVGISGNDYFSKIKFEY